MASSRTATDTPKSPLLSAEVLAQLEQLALVSRKVFHGPMRGERRSLRKGRGIELADFRNYVPGDDLRFIDWNLYARLDKLFLKLHLEEENLPFSTVLDTSDSMNFGEPTKLYYAKQLAAALGFIGLCRSDRVQIDTLDLTGKGRSPSLQGRASLWPMLQHLESIEPGANVSLLEGIKRCALRNSRRGVLVLITDLLDKSGYQRALRVLLGQSLDIYLIHLLAPEEIDPDVEGELQLIDCEDQDKAEISVNHSLLRKYQQTLSDFIGEARTFCHRRGIHYTQVSTNVPIDQMVAGYLRRGGLVR